MKTAGVLVEDVNELHALHRTIMEAKFCLHPWDTSVCGSPFVAAVANRVLDALIEAEKAPDLTRPSFDWEEWRVVGPERGEWNIALSRLEPGSRWALWSDEEKREYAEVLLSPLKASSEMLDRFVAEADERVARPKREDPYR